MTDPSHPLRERLPNLSEATFNTLVTETQNLLQQAEPPRSCAPPSPSGLEGQHVYVRTTRRTRGYFHRYSSVETFAHVILRGKVLQTQANELEICFTGNGPEFDGKTRVVPSHQLLTTRGERYRTQEIDGDLPDLGQWREDPEPPSSANSPREARNP